MISILNKRISLAHICPGCSSQHTLPEVMEQSQGSFTAHGLMDAAAVLHSRHMKNGVRDTSKLPTISAVMLLKTRM